MEMTTDEGDDRVSMCTVSVRARACVCEGNNNNVSWLVMYHH